MLQAPKNYSLMAMGGEEEENGSQEAAVTKKRASKKGAGATGSARQQLTGFEGCTHLFSDPDVYPAYQQGRCQAFHSGEQGPYAGCRPAYGAFTCRIALQRAHMPFLGCCRRSQAGRFGTRLRACSVALIVPRPVQVDGNAVTAVMRPCLHVCCRQGDGVGGTAQVHTCC